MRREDFIAGANKIVALPRLDVDRPVRGIVHAIEKQFRACGMCSSRDFGYIEYGPDGVRGYRAGHEAGAGGKQGIEIVEV